MICCCEFGYFSSVLLALAVCGNDADVIGDF